VAGVVTSGASVPLAVAVTTLVEASVPGPPSVGRVQLEQRLCGAVVVRAATAGGAPWGVVAEAGAVVAGPATSGATPMLGLGAAVGMAAGGRGLVPGLTSGATTVAIQATSSTAAAAPTTTSIHGR